MFGFSFFLSDSRVVGRVFCGDEEAHVFVVEVEAHEHRLDVVAVPFLVRPESGGSLGTPVCPLCSCYTVVQLMVLGGGGWCFLDDFAVWSRVLDADADVEGGVAAASYTLS